MIFIGHNSDAYAAVFVAGGMNFADTFYLIKKRANFMDKVIKQSSWCMSPVFGLEYSADKTNIHYGFIGYINDDK